MAAAAFWHYPRIDFTGSPVCMFTPSLIPSKPMRRIIQIAGVSASLLLAGCGWQLRGASHLPEVMSRTYIDSQDRYSEFDRALRERLKANGATVTESRRDATAVVRIRKDATGQRVLSVSAQNKPQEYEVFYDVQYSVETPAKELISIQTLELTQDYSYQESAVLAKQREEQTLREALARDLANLVLRRLAAL
jgi:LPS-assembly lipoprotein